jgi:hypothetical protein
MEEGLALVFKPKNVKPKTVRRIYHAVRDIEAVMTRNSHPDSENQLGQAMKRLCGKIGQLEAILNYTTMDVVDRALMAQYGGRTLVADETFALVRHALEIIRHHAPEVFSERAAQVLELYPTAGTNHGAATQEAGGSQGKAGLKPGTMHGPSGPEVRATEILRQIGGY